MSEFKQATRLLTITTPLGPDALLLQSLEGEDAISQPFHFTLQCLSTREEIKPQELVGLPVTVTIDVQGDEVRYINGIVRHMVRGLPVSRDFRLYTLEIVPWFWFLRYTRDHRIFQKKTVPAIIKEIFDELSFDHYDTKKLTGSYGERDYCVQYGESYFDFVSRLMEEEGIFYYFSHVNGRHTMVLGDGATAYSKCAQSEIVFSANGAYAQSIQTWDHGFSYLTGRTVRKDYDFETPKQHLIAETPSRIDLPGMKRLENYEYPGRFVKKPEGDGIAKRQMEIDEAGHETAIGSSDCRTMFAGGSFTLSRHDCPSEQGKAWAITSVRHAAMNTPFLAGQTGKESYTNSFTCIPSSVGFRPERVTPKPGIDGIQTAFVVGPEGEEIHTDKYGRVKVQFHWDRRGQYDDKSSCWIRTSQSWAGRNWGGMTIPRVGMEVVVSFVDGNPDRPLITGFVNNADNMPPYPLPDERTKSSLKTRSTPGGKGFNELRFEDKKGKEQIFIHAERDLHSRTKREVREWIGADRHLIVKGAQFELVDKNLHGHVKGDRLEKVAGGTSLDVGMDVHEKVGMNFVHKSGMNVMIEAGISINLKVGGNFITINPAGIFIQGNLVFINSGGSPAGLSASPEAPEEAQPAVDAKPGEVEKPPPPKVLPKPPAFRLPVVEAQVETLKKASEAGTPFCEVCAAAAAKAAGL
ncbi:type VI secretion system tip protein VgrG [Azospirillum sp. RWY-5-1]|uniref:Type VI secretion system tip protein VgrG n=1 Tax=Azospirillum oleiclasticum TaxID=2735135 RepID=A0ABX2T1L9_9PROT|nr:type VI secretion system tip protein VgrG [Azospirillum oleiclasticum]NYZ11047.1 type VI secretion system tip protein VgrG [Azospirillum oleiclasticum]NYZ18209.1 type VI secretion system tip protein VgrG [Azospirillum oleiclasticum]